MDEDEISEFGEMLWQACVGRNVWPYYGCGRSPLDADIVCPLHAAEINSDGSVRLSDTDVREDRQVIPVEDAAQFVCGFDATIRWAGVNADESNGMFQLGKMFREQALSGSGFR